MRNARRAFLLLACAASVAGASWPTAGVAQDTGACVAGVTDLAEMIDCLKRARGSSGAACSDGPAAEWVEPVKGKHVLSYGERTQYGATSKGIVIESERAAVAVAPLAGTVLYSGEFRSYGNIVIIDACSCQILVAGIGTNSVAAGQTVARADPIGRMTAGSGDNLPVLYLEFRVAGKAVDPKSILRN